MTSTGSLPEEENDENQSIKSNSSNANGTADSENGVWLLVTSTMGLTLGYVRIDDHDHELSLTEIREMITDKLMSNAEYANGFSFGLGWPLTPVKETEENNVFAKDVLPSVSVLSMQSANNLQMQTNPMSAATAMQYGMMGMSANNNMNWSALAGSAAHLQPLPISAVFTPISAQYYPQRNNNQTSPKNHGLKKESAESNLSNAAISSLPPFSPPVLSPEELAETAKEQKKKLQNLLPKRNGLNKKTSPKNSENKTKRKKAKVPRLKPMSRDGKVIEPPKEEKFKKTKSAKPSAEQQKALYCPGCDKKFAAERGYKQHMNKKHGIALVRGRNKERRFQCTEAGCTRSFYQRSDLRRHQRVHLGVKPFKCSLCHKEFTQRGSLYRHVTASHKGNSPKSCCVIQTGRTLPGGPPNAGTKTNVRPKALDEASINTNSNKNQSVMPGLYELPPSVNHNNADVVMRMHQRMPPPLIPMRDDDML